MLYLPFRAPRELGEKKSSMVVRLSSSVCYPGNLYLFEYPYPPPTHTHTPLISHQFLEAIWKVMTRTVYSWNGLVSEEVGGA